MTPSRLRLDLAAWGLLAIGLVVTLAVLSHDSRHPAFTSVYPRPEQVGNFLGVPGAWLAESLDEALGAAVYVFLAAWFLVVVLLLLRHRWCTWSRRVFGCFLLIPCAAVMANDIGPGWLGG